MGATTFEGTSNPTDVEAWLSQIEKCFRVMGCSEDLRIDLVAFLVQKARDSGLVNHEDKLKRKNLKLG